MEEKEDKLNIYKITIGKYKGKHLKELLSLIDIDMEAIYTKRIFIISM